jgi:hypothetical protein
MSFMSDEPLMTLRGSVMANNDLRPSEVSIYEDRIEEIKKSSSPIGGLLGKQA